ncbi:MAG TPA: iron-sulfur cluster assembly scaffold protein [Methylomirabilota bacterium]|nr:iron-sulfur cluster assembly scaffold protein [Methylomirabilota bacterium]
MNKTLEERVAELLRDPKNMGELEGADAVGTVGNAGCGEMLRLWIKFKEQSGKKVIDQATFQSFGCETAIAVASLATELIKGKTPEEALKMSGAELAGELGPLPPMKIHCAELVEGALRSALGVAPAPAVPSASRAAAPSLLEKFTPPETGGTRIVFLKDGEQP